MRHSCQSNLLYFCRWPLEELNFIYHVIFKFLDSVSNILFYNTLKIGGISNFEMFRIQINIVVFRKKKINIVVGLSLLCRDYQACLSIIFTCIFLFTIHNHTYQHLDIFFGDKSYFHRVLSWVWLTGAFKSIINKPL